MAHMKNINTSLTRGRGVKYGFCDNSMLQLVISEKKHTELLRVKVMCEQFLDQTAYEVIIDRVWFMRMYYNTKTKETDIEYNKDFMDYYEIKEVEQCD